MAKLRMAHASTHGARTPPGSKVGMVGILYSSKFLTSFFSVLQLGNRQLAGLAMTCHWQLGHR